MQGLNVPKGWRHEESYKLSFWQENNERFSTSSKIKQSILTIFLGRSLPIKLKTFFLTEEKEQAFYQSNILHRPISSVKIMISLLLLKTLWLKVDKKETKPQMTSLNLCTFWKLLLKSCICMDHFAQSF